MARYSVPLVNGQYVVPITPRAAGKACHQVVLDFGTLPSAGALKIEYRSADDNTWRTVNDARAMALVDGSGAVFFGFVTEFRMTLSSVVGGSDLAVVVQSSDTWVGPGFPVGIFEGLRAITVQHYTEANVKNGVQYQVGTYNPALPASPTPGAGFSDYVVVTGSNPISVKGRHFQFDGVGIQLETFRTPVYSGGTPLPYCNMNDLNPVAGTVQIIGAPTVSNVGTRVFPTRTFLGSTGQGNSVLQSAGLEVQGLELILAPNSAYLFRTISLNASGTQRVASYNTWYEGGLDLPRKGDGTP